MAELLSTNCYDMETIQRLKRYEPIVGCNMLLGCQAAFLCESLKELKTMENKRCPKCGMFLRKLEY